MALLIYASRNYMSLITLPRHGGRRQAPYVLSHSITEQFVFQLQSYCCQVTMTTKHCMVNATKCSFSSFTFGENENISLYLPGV